jgi:P4 family phage/plasmid primase-like protien
LQLSQGIHQLFQRKMFDSVASTPSEKDAQELHKKRLGKISDIILVLKNHTKKMNIMKEAADLFYEDRFTQKLDSKPYLLGCVNGVVDFEDPELIRPGKPDDYISKCTGIEAVRLAPEHDDVVEEINTFMEQLFPVTELREYMWDHISSLLIGGNRNQTFNIYTGVGCNGKSVFVDFLSQILGEYKATVPVTLITSKRPGIGASSSEVAQLMGIRYAVMQEPSKGDRINEGMMKELCSGNDPIQARQLFQESVTFEAQFKLVMCANDLPEIKSNDEGTWRRIRVCPFMSRFKEVPNYGNPSEPYQFLVDKNIHKKFAKWRTVMLAMLIERAKKTMGIVSDCGLVLEKSNEYRLDQDVFAEFIRVSIKVDLEGSVKQTDLSEAFSTWWQTNHTKQTRQPAFKELQAYMIRRNVGVQVKPLGSTMYWNKISLIQQIMAEGFV